jgi:hypothetical protein
LYKYYIHVTKAERMFRQGEKEMLMKMLLDTYRDVTRQIAPGQSVTTVPVTLGAANASRWINEETKGRRQRRQRRMERADSHRINGWTVRTW